MRILLLLTIFMFPLFAIVDIATVDFGDNQEGFSGALYGSFEKKRGNTDKDEMEYGGRIQYDTNSSITWLQGESEKDKASGTTTDDNSFVHLRHVHQLYTPEWAWEIFLQNKKDSFKNLDSRFLSGGGVRYRLFKSKEYGKLFAGMGLVDEHIDYTANSDDTNEHNTRLSSYLSYRAKINNNLEFSSISYYLPKVNDGSDYLFSSLTELTMHLTKVFDLSYILEFDYDSNPASDVDTTDTRQKLSFIYRFGKDDPFSAYATNFLTSTDDLADVNSSKIVAVEVQMDVDEIKNSSDTLVGDWVMHDQKISILLDGTGSYVFEQGIYHQQLEWKLISTETQEGIKGAKAQETKIVVIRYVDEEGRIGRIENYLWSDNRLVGLSGDKVQVFKR